MPKVSKIGKPEDQPRKHEMTKARKKAECLKLENQVTSNEHKEFRSQIKRIPKNQEPAINERWRTTDFAR
jgi:hypothetical protein